MEVIYYFSATDDSPLANSGTFPATAPDEYFRFNVLPSSDNDVLLAYSGYQDYTDIEFITWRQALNEANISFDEYNWQEWQQVEYPAQYKTIFFYASSCSHNDVIDGVSLNLMNWLDTGTEEEPKNIFFSSDNFAYSQGGQPNANPMKKLLNAYFRTSYVGTTIGGGTNGLGGPNSLYFNEGSFRVWTDSPLGNVGNEIEVLANSPDCIFRYEQCPSWYEDEVVNPEIGAQNAFIFEDGPINGQAYLYHGVCGTWIDNEIYKAFLFTFDFSQIVSSEQRTEIVLDCANWFDITVDKDESNLVPVTDMLQQNYPNPFFINDLSRNQETVINFSGKTAKSAELNIFDIKGRKVKSMIQELDNGYSDHSFTWNGYDKQNRLVGSGIYLYTLKLDGSFSAARKMIIIR